MTKTYVLVYLRVSQDNRDAVVHAYQQTSWVNSAIDGLLRTELLVDNDDSNRWVLFSEWASLAAYRAWRRGPDHEDGAKVSPLRPYQDRSREPHYVIYQPEAGAAASY
ncbi:antibiotic biosynthesis monooxygenase family protein [Nocardia salmonicida]|uniref:antibiotic biosynthesis monooxygenase family protein n=1 Tax=Nocardia salmonicida TaxID=53431 RepID=UPI003CE9D3A7